MLRAGLWEQTVCLSQYGEVDYAAIYQMASDQSVVGLVAAGIEHAGDISIPKKAMLHFAQRVLQFESRNAKMNAYIGELVSSLRAAGINPLLVKGQGIARCYAKPEWRAAGDIDLLFADKEDYERAKALLLPSASAVHVENTYLRHIGMTLSGWEVELHGSLYTRLSKRIDNFVDRVQEDTFANRHVRELDLAGIKLEVPAPDNDVIFVFTHILHHFYIEGIGLRQICDWCRLLWTFRDSIDVPMLEERLKAMGLMSEWKAFAAYAVDYLGLPPEAMPLYSAGNKWKRKAVRINSFVMKVGNFGYKRRAERTAKTRSYLWHKIRSVFYKTGDYARHTLIFPLDSPRFFCHLLVDGIGAAKRGE